MKKSLIYGLIGLGISGGIGYFLGKKRKEKQNTLMSIKLALSMGKRIQTKSGEPVKIIQFYEFLNKVSVSTKSMANGTYIEFTPKEFWEVFEAVD